MVHAAAAALRELQGSLGSARERRAADAVYECGLVCGSCGMEAAEFDARLATLLERHRNDLSTLEQNLLQMCLEACAGGAPRRPEAERPERDPWPAVMRRIASMQKRFMDNVRLDRLLDAMQAMWHAHGDNEAVEMEVELFNWLKRTHNGDKAAMGRAAVAFVSALDELAPLDADVRVFRKILRNQIDQGFWKVRCRLRQTVREQVRQGKSAGAILAHMYNAEDAALLMERLSAGEAGSFEDMLLDFHLERHEALIAPFKEAYASQGPAFTREMSFSAYVRSSLLGSSPP